MSTVTDPSLRPAGEVLVADAPQVCKGPNRLGRLPGDIQTEVEDLFNHLIVLPLPQRATAECRCPDR